MQCGMCSFYEILLPPTTPPSMLCDDCFRAELSKNSLLFGLLCCGFTLLLLQIKAYISHRPCKLGPPFEGKTQRVLNRSWYAETMTLPFPLRSLEMDPGNLFVAFR